MKSIITMILLLIAGQASAAEQVIDVQHDSVRGVTCWILNNTGISCLPDSSLQPRAPTSTSTDESQAARASLTTSMRQNEQLSTGLLPHEKGFQL